MEISIPSETSLPEAARNFLAALPAGTRVIDFDGPMGAGKTTFISALCRELGSPDDVSSPTFSIINEYNVPGKTGHEATLCHFDFYRLQSAAEAMDIGAEDYFYSGSICLLEWAANVEEILPDDTLHVTISVNHDGSRKLSF